jgi:hypothetical protein
MKQFFLLLMGLMLLTGSIGCSIKQQVTKLEKPLPQEVCIVEHSAVKQGVLIAIQDTFNIHSIPNQVVSGIYEKKNAMWVPRWQKEQVTDCDALLFYTAHWNWDLANYMYLADIWMTTPDGVNQIAKATYDASMGGGRPDKFIIARDKILELTEEMITGNAKPPTGFVSEIN